MLALNVLEHVLVFTQNDVVRKYFGVFLVKGENFREAYLGFLGGVGAFQKFRDIVIDQVVFEYAYDLSRLIVNYIVNYLYIVVIFACHILSIEVILD